jgi:hypothetical protein
MDMAKLVKKLKGESYNAIAGEDDSISFQHEGSTYLILLDSKDPQYVRIVFPNFWTFKEVERTTMVMAAHTATSDIKAAKIHVFDPNIWAAVEFYSTTEAEVVAVLKHCIASLQAVAAKFVTLVS